MSFSISVRHPMVVSSPYGKPYTVSARISGESSPFTRDIVGCRLGSSPKHANNRPWISRYEPTRIGATYLSGVKSRGISRRHTSHVEITSAIVKYLEQLHQQTATGSTLGRQLEELESGLPGHQSYGSKDGGRVRLVDAGRPMRGLTRYEIQLLSAYYLGSDGYRTGAAGAGGGEVSDRSSSYATFTAIGRARGMSARDVEFDWKVARNKVRKNLERL